MIGYGLIILAVILIITAFLFIKKGKETSITYLISGILLIGGALSGFFGFDNINNKPHTYTVTQNIELSKNNYKITLKKENGGTTILPSVNEEQAKDFPLNEEVTFTNSQLSKYRD